MPHPQDHCAAEQAHRRSCLVLAMLIPCSILTMLQEEIFTKISKPSGQLERGLRWSLERMVLLCAQVSPPGVLVRSFQVEVRWQSDTYAVWLITELRSRCKPGVSQAGSVGSPRQEWGRQGSEPALSMGCVLRPQGTWQDLARSLPSVQALCLGFWQSKATPVGYKALHKKHLNLGR